MGVGAGVIRMKNVPVKTTDSADIEKQESDLAEAYAQSAEHDKKIAAEFHASLADGLVNTHVQIEDCLFQTSIPKAGSRY